MREKTGTLLSNYNLLEKIKYNIIETFLVLNCFILVELIKQ